MQKKIEELESEIENIIYVLSTLESCKNYKILDNEGKFLHKILGQNLELGLLQEFKNLYSVYKSYLKELNDNGVKVENSFEKDLKNYKTVSHLI